jgi:hypothetical protein
MAYTERIRHHGVAPRDRVVEEPANQVDVAPNHEINVVSRIIWVAAGILLLLLAFRFLLAFLGANPANTFAHFVYNVSYPFVVPFFNLFRYNNIQNGVSRVEIYTLVAMVVYAAVAWVLAALANIGRRP